MARTPTKTSNAEFLPPETTQAFDDGMQAMNELAKLNDEQLDNALAIARKLGYEGELRIGALEDEIRFYQRRTVEACLELGKRLLVLKELTPHGEFKERVQMLDIAYSTATRFMSATIKFSNVDSNQLLKAAKTQTKLLELLILDDEEVAALEKGETVRGLKLDKIETMTVSELKKALRTAQDEISNKESIIQKKDQHINRLDEELIKKQKAIATQSIGEQELIDMQEQANQLRATITASLNSRIQQLFKAFDDTPPEHIRLAGAQALGQIITAAYDLAQDLGLSPDTNAEAAAEHPAKRMAQEFEAWEKAQGIN